MVTFRSSSTISLILTYRCKRLSEYSVMNNDIDKITIAHGGFILCYTTAVFSSQTQRGEQIFSPGPPNFTSDPDSSFTLASSVNQLGRQALLEPPAPKTYLSFEIGTLIQPQMESRRTRLSFDLLPASAHAI